MTKTVNQQTIDHDVRFSGRTLQTGREVDVICRSSGPDTGIAFKRTDLPESPALNLQDAVLSSTHARRSTITSGGVEIQTVEHFLASLWALGIDNMLVEINDAELPAMDGSAKEFVRILKAGGTIDQQIPKKVIRIHEKEKVERDGSSITVTPYEGFNVSYLIDYDIPSIGRELFDIELDSDSFEEEIAPARTFCLKKEADALLKAGLGKGATLDNTLVLDDEGPVGTHLRFSNEPLRHKILDLVGDLYILGRPVIGKVTAEMSGHALNSELINKLYKKYV